MSRPAPKAPSAPPLESVSQGPGCAGKALVKSASNPPRTARPACRGWRRRLVGGSKGRARRKLLAGGRGRRRLRPVPFCGARLMAALDGPVAPAHGQATGCAASGAGYGKRHRTAGGRSASYAPSCHVHHRSTVSRNRRRFGSSFVPGSQVHDGPETKTLRTMAASATRRLQIGPSVAKFNLARAFALRCRISLGYSVHDCNACPVPIQATSSDGFWHQACRSATNLRAFDQNRGSRPNGASAVSASATSYRQPRLGAGAAEHADHRGLAGGGVLAGRFADQRRIAFEIEKIVGDLEGLADRRSIALERLALRRLGRGRECRRPRSRSAAARRSSSPAASARRSRRAAAAPLHEAAFGGEIEHLAAGHAADAGGARQRPHQLDAHARIGMGFRRATGCRRRRSAGRRRQGWRSPRRISCARSAGRAANRHCPWPADRHAPANSNARIPAPRRPSARCCRGTPNRAAHSTTRNGRNRLPPPRLE